MPVSLKRSLWWVLVPAMVALFVMLDRPRTTKPAHQAEWLDAAGVPLRTLRAGGGDTTLFLIHGFGESLFTWRAIVDPLATHYRVVAIDLPGFGGSGKPDGPYVVDSMTARLSGFLDRWILGPVIVVGHSMGGQLAASLALSRPDRIAAAVLIAPAGFGLGLAGIADTISPEKAAAIGWYLASRAMLLPEHDAEWIGEPDSAAAYSLMTDPNYRRAATRILNDFDFRSLRTRFAEIWQPVLLIWGTLDPVIPYPLADSVRVLLPCGRLAALSGALHRPQVEIPDTVTSLILNFSRHPSCA